MTTTRKRSRTTTNTRKGSRTTYCKERIEDNDYCQENIKDTVTWDLIGKIYYYAWGYRRSIYTLGYLAWG